MKKFTQWSIILIISAFLLGIVNTTYAFNEVYGVKIEQRALDLLTMLSLRMAEISAASDLEQVLSLKARIVISDVVPESQSIGPLSEEQLQQLPEMIVESQIEILRSSPDLVSVSIKSNLFDLQFIVNETESLAVLPGDGLYTKLNIPQILPDSILFQGDGGLFTLINLMGGLPYGSLLHQADGIGGIGGPDITFGEVDSEDMRATIRYWGKDKVDAGVVHSVNILTTGAAPYSQSMRIWVLEDTLDLYQISIEDARGTQIFIMVDELNTTPAISEADFTLDVSSLIETDYLSFLEALVMGIVSSPAVENPVAVDLIASSDEVARTGVLTISSDGFDIQDEEVDLLFEAEYMSVSGSWEPLDSTEYAGLTPLGHWNATFVPGEAAELGPYSFRVRYTDTSGNVTEWLEAIDLVTVTPAPPRVVRTEPINGEVEAPISTNISITFSKPMDKESVENNLLITYWFNRQVQGEIAWEDNTLIFSPLEDLKYNTSYVVRVTGEAKDSEGVGLDGNYDVRSDGIPYDDYYWSFTTAAAPPKLAAELGNKPIYIAGDRFDLKIMARDVVRMSGFSLKLTFDPEVLEVEKAVRASYTSWRPRSRFIEDVDVCGKPVVDNLSGSVTIACDSTMAGGVTGSGEIATLKLYAIGAGEASFGFDEVSFVNSSGKAIDLDLMLPDVQILEFHPMDVNHDGIVNILDSVAILSEEDSNGQAAPHLAQTKLGQNYPNPFNPETWIPYQLAQPSYVTVRIYRSTGEVIRTLDLGAKEAGFYSDKTKAAYWDGTDNTGQKVSSGVYFYTVQADGFAATRKMLLCQ